MWKILGWIAQTYRFHWVGQWDSSCFNWKPLVIITSGKWHHIILEDFGDFCNIPLIFSCNHTHKTLHRHTLWHTDLLIYADLHSKAQTHIRRCTYSKPLITLNYTHTRTHTHKHIKIHIAISVNTSTIISPSLRQATATICGPHRTLQIYIMNIYYICIYIYVRTNRYT